MHVVLPASLPSLRKHDIISRIQSVKESVDSIAPTPFNLSSPPPPNPPDRSPPTHAKSMISGMLSISFKGAKCKTSLKLAVARIKLLKNKRTALVQQMRRELAQLLETGQDHTARIRVEHVIREEKTMSAYDLIGIYCDLIVARLPIIESQKNCPIDLKEAISSVIFASPRCADIPELNDIRKHLTAKYGKEFVTSALEVRPDSGVNRMMIEKLSARAPDVETKLKVMTEVAKENNIKWEPKSFVDEIQKPKDDLLNGPASFTSANKMMMESSDLKPSSTQCWNNESTTKVYENAVAGKPTSLNTVSGVNITSPETSVTPRGLESRTVGGEVTYTYYSKGNASLNCTDWSMDFKDAASAAKAAAESAERASMAARAAAELASRGNFSRQHSASHESSAYVIKDERSESLKSSTLERTYTLEKPVNMEDDKRKVTVDMKLEIQNLQRHHVMQISSKKEAESLSYNHATGGDATSKGSFFGDSSISNAVSRTKPGPRSCYDGHSSKSEDEKGKLEDAEAVKPNLHSESSFRKGSSAVGSGHGTSFEDKKEVEQFTLGCLSAASPDVGNPNLEAESSSSEKSWRSFSLSVRNKQHTPRNDSSPRKHDDSGRGLKEEDMSHSATADESYEIGSLNLGRLTGGLRNMGCHHPPYVRSVSLASSPGSKSTSGDAPPVYEKKTLSTVVASTASYEATIEESSLDDSLAKAYASRSRVSRFYADSSEKKQGKFSRNAIESGATKTEGSLISNKSTDDMSTITKKPVIRQHNRIPEDLGNPVQVSYIQRKHQKDDKDSILASSLTNFISDRYEEQYYVVGSGQCRDNTSTPRKQNPDVSPTTERSTFSSPSNTTSSEVQIKELCDQRSNLKEYDGSSFRRPINYPNLGDKAAEELEPLNVITRRTTSNVKHSPRTRDIPSVAKEDSMSRIKCQSVRGTAFEQQLKSLQSSNIAESFSKTIRDTGEGNDKVSSKPQQPYSSAEQPSLKHLNKESPTVKRSPSLSKHELEQSSVAENGEPKTQSSTGKLISRESSLKRASHVHPKLPDYDVIAAHLRSLRSNRHPT